MELQKKRWLPGGIKFSATPEFLPILLACQAVSLKVLDGSIKVCVLWNHDVQLQ